MRSRRYVSRIRRSRIAHVGTVIGSGLDGINVLKAPSTLTGNRALHNGRWGIEAVSGLTDGGGNHAAGNGEPAQCLGVAC